MTSPYQVKRYRNGDEHYERCHGLDCPCYQEGKAEREATDGHSDREVAASAPARPDDAIGAET